MNHLLRAPHRSLLGVFAVVAVITGASACGDDDAPTSTPIPSQPSTQITISDPWARTTTNDLSAAYMVITNGGAEDRLVSAKADISSKVQIHEVVVDGSTSKMQELAGGLPIPANGRVELKPGSYHIMMMMLTDPLTVGEKVELDLTFEKAGVIHVTAMVREGSGMSGAGGTTTPGGMTGGMQGTPNATPSH